MARSHARALLTTVAVLGLMAGLAAETREIDAQRSKLTVHVYKSGLFSALADNHVIEAPIGGGSVSEEQPLSVELAVRAAALRVLDPGLSPSKRADVQTRMLGAEVLDVAKYPDITFVSTTVTPTAGDAWMVAGRLTIHGQARPLTVSVSRQSGSYRGSVDIKQRDFGIQPISIAGGTVKVKDQLKIEFDIVLR